MNVKNPQLLEKTLVAKMRKHLKRWDSQSDRQQYRKLIRRYPSIAEKHGFEEKA